MRPSRKTGRGTQTLDRAIRLLKMLTTRSTVGWRLTDLAAQCELDKATAYRLLQALERHRLAKQRASDRHYAPGPLLFELGLAFPALAQFQTACRPSLARLARRPGGAALLYLRSEEDFVCIARVGGEQMTIPDLRTTIDLQIVERIVHRFSRLADAGGWGAKFGRELNATDDRRYFELDSLYAEICKPWQERRLPMEHHPDPSGTEVYARWRELNGN